MTRKEALEMNFGFNEEIKAKGIADAPHESWADSISVEEGEFTIWFHNNSIREYWEEYKHRWEKQGGEANW